MRFHLFMSPERAVELGRWHRWFAWRPVWIGGNEFAWLETVQRRGDWRILGRWDWQYRPDVPAEERADG